MRAAAHRSPGAARDVPGVEDVERPVPGAAGKVIAEP
jgi:hypothetical protein